MAGEPAEQGRVEQAIYLVGGLILFLFGVQSVSAVLLVVYGYVRGVSTPPLSSPLWVDWGVEGLVGALSVAAGLMLLWMAWRERRRLAGTR